MYHPPLTISGEAACRLPPPSPEPGQPKPLAVSYVWLYKPRELGTLSRTLGVLLAAADKHKDPAKHGRRTFKKNGTLAGLAGIGDRTLKTHVKRLEEMGHVKTEAREGAKTPWRILTRSRDEWRTETDRLRAPVHALHLDWESLHLYAWLILKCHKSTSTSRTVLEMSTATGLARDTVPKCLAILANEGLVEWTMSISTRRPVLTLLHPPLGGAVEVRPGAVEVRPSCVEVRPSCVEVRPSCVEVRPENNTYTRPVLEFEQDLHHRKEVAGESTKEEEPLILKLPNVQSNENEPQDLEDEMMNPQSEEIEEEGKAPPRDDSSYSHAGEENESSNSTTPAVEKVWVIPHHPGCEIKPRAPDPVQDSPEDRWHLALTGNLQEMDILLPKHEEIVRLYVAGCRHLRCGELVGDVRDCIYTADRPANLMYHRIKAKLGEDIAGQVVETAKRPETMIAIRRAIEMRAAKSREIQEKGRAELIRRNPRYEEMMRAADPAYREERA